MWGRICLFAVLTGLVALAGAAMGSISINSTSPLPAGAEGLAYSQTLTASGGALPYVWTLAGGALPQGLTLNPDGSIGGTPLASGVFSFAVRVTDSNGQTDTKDYSLTSNPASSVPKITIDSPLPEGIVGTLYSQRLTATGGKEPYTWAAAPRDLPPGLTLESNGTLGGTPTSQGEFKFTITVTDASGTANRKEFSVNFKPSTH